MCTLKEEAGGPGGGWKLGLGKTRRKKKMGARVSFVIAPPYTYTTRHAAYARSTLGRTKDVQILPRSLASLAATLILSSMASLAL